MTDGRRSYAMIQFLGEPHDQRDESNPPSTVCHASGRKAHSGRAARTCRFLKQYGHARITDVEGEWIANPRHWWMQEAQLSPAQYDRASAKLAELKLIEKCQWWYGRKCILFLRPTALTMDFLAAAKTWQAAYELLEEPQYGFSVSANPGVANLLKSKKFSKNAKPSSAISLNPKDIKTLHGNLHKEGVYPCAHQAAPSCTKITGQSKKEIPGKKEKAKPATFKKTANPSSGSSGSLPTVSLLRNAWHTGMHQYYGDAVTTSSAVFEFPPKEWGSLGLIIDRLREISWPRW